MQPASDSSQRDFPLARVRHFLVDMDGVLYRGSTMIPGADRFISWLRGRRFGFRLVTNNATLTQDSFRDKVAAMGIEVDPSEIFTSSLATARYLEQEGARGGTVWPIGEDGLRSALQSLAMTVTPERPQWVVAGLDRQATYRDLATAALAIERGARFVATNPDTSLPTEEGLLPGAGALQAALIATTGVHPVVVGKPQPLMLRLAMEDLDGTTEDTVMLGDRLDTDIAGARAAGLPSILVLTGTSSRAEVAAGDLRPTLLVDTPDDLIAQWP